MYAVICRPEYWKYIDELVTEQNSDILINIVSRDVDMYEELAKISLVSVKHLIIDLSCVLDDKKFIYALRQYKIRNEKTQIIIISPESISGNPLLHQLVTQIQIYDIIASIDGLDGILLKNLIQKAIERPATFKDGIRYMNVTMDDPNEIPKKNDEENRKQSLIKPIKPIKVTEYKNVVLDNRNIIVSGLHRGSGASLISTILSGYLDKKKIYNALIEIPAISKPPYIYDYLGIDKLVSLKEDQCLSILNDTKSNNASADYIRYGNITFAVQDPKNEKIEDWNIHDTSRLLLSLDDSPIKIIDANIEDSSLNELLNFRNTLVFLVVDCLPVHFNQQLDKILSYKEMDNVYLIINKTNSSMKNSHYIKAIPEFDNILYFPYISFNNIYKASYNSKFLTDDSHVLDLVEDDLLKIIHKFMSEDAVKKDVVDKKSFGLSNLKKKFFKEGE